MKFNEKKKSDKKKNKEIKSGLTNLPDEILVEVLSLLSVKKLSTMSQVSTLFHAKENESEVLWASLLKKKYDIISKEGLQKIKRPDETYRDAFIRLSSTSYMAVTVTSDKAYDPIKLLNNPGLYTSSVIQSDMIFRTKDEADKSLEAKSSRGCVYIVELNMSLDKAKKIIDGKEKDKLCVHIKRVYPENSSHTIGGLNNLNRESPLTVVGDKEPRIVNVSYDEAKKKFHEVHTNASGLKVPKR